jgi:hypothetical protein
MNNNEMRQEYVTIFNKLKQEWRLLNTCPFVFNGVQGFRTNQLNDYILKRSPMIERLGKLHRGLDL